MKRLFRTLLPVSIALFLLLAVVTHSARADLIDDLKLKIDERNDAIKNLDLEIAQYNAQIEKTSAQGLTLKNKIATLELTRKKILAEISSIQSKISSATLSINKLSIQISNAEDSILKERTAISHTLSQMNDEESASFAEIVLNNVSISVFLDRVESFSQLNDSLKIKLANVRTLKAEIESQKISTVVKRTELVGLANNLSDKKKVAEYNKAQTNKLLAETKNTEANYRKILLQKQALRDAFDSELRGYESQLKIAIDPNSLPTIGAGVLKWPLDSVKITQYFGNTDFSKTHTQVYNGMGHNGIDLKAPIGTKVKSALEGVVLGTGNTDTACPNASYGKWVLVQHPNGLSTLYAHFSVIKVVPGQNVSTGELLGYSGETGYATGPHLHFTVYASQGVKIMTRKSKVCNASYTMPIGSLNAYLDPLQYL